MVLTANAFGGKVGALDERLTSEGALRRYGTAPAVGSLANDKDLTQARLFWPGS